MKLEIENHGPLIVRSNYWGGPLDQAGTLFVSGNAGAFRILLPTGWEQEVNEMRSGKSVIVSRGHWQTPLGREALEFLFDDGSQDPYSFHVGADQCDHLPPIEDVGREWLCTIWTAPRRGKPHKALERVCHYRIVPVLPYLKPLGK